MSDELNVWTFEGCSIGEYRNAEYAKGYQRAIYDVVAWINSGAGPYVEGYGEEIANEITRRFGKDA